MNARLESRGPMLEALHVAGGRTDRQDDMLVVDRNLHADALNRLHAIVSELLSAIGTVLKDDRAEFESRVRHAAALLRTGSFEAADAPTTTAVDAAAFRGGLAPWQERKINNFILANLESTVLVEDLAALVDLSRFHFSRAFRKSFGESPHAFIMRKRIEHAQGLMLSSATPLAQIAADCGLADQAHFTRLFRQLVGEPPGAWRRARMCPR